jgi:hypothetical protein
MVERVIAWFGPEENESAFAIQFLDLSGSKVEISWHDGMVRLLETDKDEPH